MYTGEVLASSGSDVGWQGVRSSLLKPAGGRGSALAYENCKCNFTTEFNTIYVVLTEVSDSSVTLGRGSIFGGSIFGDLME